MSWFTGEYVEKNSVFPMALAFSGDFLFFTHVKKIISVCCNLSDRG